MFLVIHEEVSFGARAYAFSEQDWALKMASRILSSHAKDPENIDDRLTQDMETAGVLYHAVYNDDGDCVRVERTALLDRESISFSEEH